MILQIYDDVKCNQAIDPKYLFKFKHEKNIWKSQIETLTYLNFLEKVSKFSFNLFFFFLSISSSKFGSTQDDLSV